MLKKNIQTFLELEEMSKDLLTRQKLIRDQKKKVEAEIIEYLIKNKIEKSKINFGSNSIVVGENFTPGSLSMSLVFDTLCKILDKENAQKICDLIQDVRDKNGKESRVLKIKKRTKK